jgi:hypothetical protein
VSDRQKTLDGALMTEKDEILRKNGVDRSQYKEVVQINCPAIPTAKS